jgi:hypothetical protein
MTASQCLTVAGLTMTLIGAAMLSWWDLVGGGKTTIGSLERGLPRTRSSRIAFPLIALGTALQIVGTLAA